MRISDWSSDVCSSDLGHRTPFDLLFDVEVEIFLLIVVGDRLDAPEIGADACGIERVGIREADLRPAAGEVIAKGAGAGEFDEILVARVAVRLGPAGLEMDREAVGDGKGGVEGKRG